MRELRLGKGLSQEKLAFEADIQRNYVSLLERGHSAVSLKILFRLAAVLDVVPSEILKQVEAHMRRDSRRTRG